MTDKQPELFPKKGAPGEYGPPVTQIRAINSGSSLAMGASAYHDYMIRQGFSKHTIKAFAGDLRLLQKYFGNSMAVGALKTKDLNDFLTWLLHYRGVPCSPKSYARRITTLKSFFGWLKESKVLPHNPAEAVLQVKVKAPLPTYLTDDKVEKLLDAAEKSLKSDKADPRPYFLTHLLLQTGIKKAECVNIQLDDIDRSGDLPTILIRYSNPRMQHKERRLSFATDLLPVLDQYLKYHQPQEKLFECTPRNLEYVLTDVSSVANLSQQASFEMLRWTSALRDYRDGMEHDRLRRKLGLSKITWRETEQKLAKLSEAL
ncbi:site-specific integrase [Anaerolineales bacterium HSG25]|nr:site-specific integrase [Anaerolineales bacterium HSG25]